MREQLPLGEVRSSMEPKVLLCGLGQVGICILDLLRKTGHQVVVVDLQDASCETTEQLIASAFAAR